MFPWEGRTGDQQAPGGRRKERWQRGDPSRVIQWEGQTGERPAPRGHRGGGRRGTADLLEEQTVGMERHNVFNVGHEADGRLPVESGMREGKPDRDFVLGRFLERRNAGYRKDVPWPVDVDAVASGEATAEVVRGREGKPEAKDRHVGGRGTVPGGAPHLAGFTVEAPTRRRHGVRLASETDVGVEEDGDRMGLDEAAGGEVGGLRPGLAEPGPATGRGAGNDAWRRVLADVLVARRVGGVTGAHHGLNGSQWPGSELRRQRHDKDGRRRDEDRLRGAREGRGEREEEEEEDFRRVTRYGPG